MVRKRVRTNAHAVKVPTVQTTLNEQCKKVTPNSTPVCDSCTECRKVTYGNTRRKTCYTCNRHTIFPRWFPWILVPIILTIRLYYVLEPKNWWILHPDEVFQTIEVAHTDAFGYGFRPYEYLPPPSAGNHDNSTLSEAKLQEIRHGMYSLRSFILPKVLSVVMVAADLCGVTWSPFLVIKVFHVVVTSTLPLCVYQLSQSLQQSRDVSTLSAILVCFSLSLNVFGTHTFINSFLSPLVIISLVDYIRIIRNDNSYTASMKQEEQSRFCKQGPVIDMKRTPFTEKVIKTFQQLWCAGKSQVQCYNIYNKKESVYDPLSTKGPKSDGRLESRDEHDENGNIYLRESKRNGRVEFSRKAPSVHRTTDLWSLATLRSNVTKQGLRECTSGFFLAVCIYIRVDLALIPVLLFVLNRNYTYFQCAQIFERCKCYLLGFVSGILIGGYIDYVTYGVMFISPVQWFTFNVWNDKAGEIFGTSSSQFYINKLYQNEPLFTLLSVIVLVECCSSIFAETLEITASSSKSRVGVSNQSLLLFISLLMVFSFNSHKEFRFLHNAIIFFYISVSRAMISLCTFTTRLLLSQNGFKYSSYCVYLFVVLFVSSHVHVLFTQPDQSKWTYGGNRDSQNDNACLDFIRHQDDVTGVFLDSSFKMSGAYSILHKNVPLLTLNIYEFMEYTHRRSYDVRRSYSGIHGNRYTDFSDISDFISIYNTPYLLKQLIVKQRYNYLVLKTHRAFIDIGYKEVYRAGNSKVLRRTFDVDSERSLAETSSQISIGLNATVLEYEGGWLKHFGLYVQAEQRLIQANRLDSTRIGPFRILLDMYKMLHRTTSYKNVLSACLQVHTLQNCLRHSEPVVLHTNYYRI